MDDLQFSVTMPKYHYIASHPEENSLRYLVNFI